METVISVFLCFIFYLPQLVTCEDGVCETTVRETDWAMVPVQTSYIETYKEKCYKLFSCTKTRKNYRYLNKAVRKVSYKTKKICCAGYHRENEYLDNIICSPICSRGCFQGTCTSPQVCTCYFGYEKSYIGNICVPSCTEECVNATCIAPDSCECFKGFEHMPNNETACAPKCSTGCPNGACIEPETCVCDIGYVLKEGICIPECEYDCGNGTCLNPNECQCDSGYINNENGTCVPFCDKCDNGECIAPNNCDCFLGYLSINDECQPQCDNINCDNGTCTAPNTCQCNDGFIREDGVCQPFCNKCINGYCETTDQCKCLEGFVPSDNDSQICEAIKCANCTNGDCIDGICACYVGYELVDLNCEPICVSCVNAVCKEPDICECLPGYNFVNNYECEEVIDQEMKGTTEVTSLTTLGFTEKNVGETSTITELVESGEILDVKISDSSSYWMIYAIGILVITCVGGIAILLWRKGFFKFNRSEYSTADSEGSIIYNGTDTLERSFSNL